MMSRFRLSFLAAVAAVTGLLVAGCAGGGTAAQSSTAKNAAKGTAFVGYAGSLTLTNDQYLGPAFEKKTGLSYRGHAAGAFAVAQLISSGEIQPNVFESIGTGPIDIVKPKFTTWAVGFVAQPLVVAYSPKSPYAAELKAIASGQKPLTDLFTLMEKPGFHLGRTNPQTDPQGQAFVIMMKLAAKKYNLPAGTVDKILGPLENPSEVFPETSIISRLQAGQLDASSAYMPEAVQRHLPFIKFPDDVNLGNPNMASAYAAGSLTVNIGGKSKTITGAPMVVYVTTISGTPDPQAGVSFVQYLLSPAGRSIYQKMGYTLIKPVTYGDVNAIPSAIKSELK